MIPVIIIGAGRSGTNILRDILSASPRAATWPCDEINYAWRYGNRSFPTDELTPRHAQPKTRRYMRRMFDRLAEQTGAEFIIEKTCANSLRVEYVAEIFPDARFVVIEREPLDVVASAIRRWRGELDLGYVSDKVRYVPKTDLLYYAMRYARHRLRKLVSREGILPTWGPRFDGIDEAVERDELHIICAKQYRTCVHTAQEQIARIAPRQVYGLRYEDLARDPARVVGELTEALFGHPDEACLEFATKNVTPASVGKGHGSLTSAQIAEIRTHV